MRAVVLGGSLSASVRSVGGADVVTGAAGAGAAATAAGATICGGPAEATFTGAARTTRVLTRTGCNGAVEPGIVESGWVMTPLVNGAGRCAGAACCGTDAVVSLACGAGTAAAVFAIDDTSAVFERAVLSRCALAPSSAT